MSYPATSLEARPVSGDGDERRTLNRSGVASIKGTHSGNKGDKLRRERTKVPNACEAGIASAASRSVSLPALAEGS